MSARLLSRIVFTDEKSRRNAHDYKIYGIHLEKDVQLKLASTTRAQGLYLTLPFTIPRAAPAMMGTTAACMPSMAAITQ